MSATVSRTLSTPVPAISSFSGAAYFATHSHSWIFSSVVSMTLSPVEPHDDVAGERREVPLLDVVLDLGGIDVAVVVERSGDGGKMPWSLRLITAYFQYATQAGNGQTRSMVLLSIQLLSSAFRNFISSRTTRSALS